MTESDRQILIWLTAVQGIGLKTIENILNRVKDFDSDLADILKNRTSFFKKISLGNAQVESLLAFQKIYSPATYLEFLNEKEIEVVCFDQEKYPSLLKEVASFPYVLYVKGPMDFWQNLPISVVGTRHLTDYGEQAARVITGELVDLGATIVSGYMYGADMQAHLAALQKNGKSVGVLGYGFDYLPESSEQYPTQKFLESGNTFISEFAPFVAAHKGNFPIRNRIVAGMSLATVVIEAAQRSGSLITAQYALDFNRSVCAVPGPFNSIYSEGTKNLVNQGAKLITSGFEVISEVQLNLGDENTSLSERERRKENHLSQLSDPVDQEILLLLSSESLSTEKISEKLQLELSSILTYLSILEIKRLIYRRGDKWWSYL